MDWNIVNIYKDIFEITIVAEDISTLIEAKDKKYRIMWGYPIYTFWELRQILELGVNEVLIESPLYFDLK